MKLFFLVRCDRWWVGQMMILCFVFMCGSVYAYELQTFFF